MAFKVFAPGVLTSSDVNTFLMRQAVITCTSSTRPASPSEGMTIYETDTDVYRVYDGSTWEFLARHASGPVKTYTPTFGTDGSPNYGSATVAGRYVEVGELVHVTIQITWAGGVTYPSSVGVRVSTPTGVQTAAPVPNQLMGIGRMFDSSLGRQYPLLAQVSNDSFINLFAYNHNLDAVSTTVTGITTTAISSGLDAPTDSGDHWACSLWYERG